MEFCFVLNFLRFLLNIDLDMVLIQFWESLEYKRYLEALGSWPSFRKKVQIKQREIDDLSQDCSHINQQSCRQEGRFRRVTKAWRRDCFRRRLQSIVINQSLYFHMVCSYAVLKIAGANQYMLIQKELHIPLSEKNVYLLISLCEKYAYIFIFKFL